MTKTDMPHVDSIFVGPCLLLGAEILHLPNETCFLWMAFVSDGRPTNAYSLVALDFTKSDDFNEFFSSNEKEESRSSMVYDD